VEARSRGDRSPRRASARRIGRDLRDEREDDDCRDDGEILRNRFRLAYNSSGANLVSGVASTLLDASDAELGLFEVDEGALPEIVARVRPNGRLPRQSLPRPARPLRRARARRSTLA
jgi:hypothetical protein